MFLDERPKLFCYVITLLIFVSYFSLGKNLDYYTILLMPK